MSKPTQATHAKSKAIVIKKNNELSTPSISQALSVNSPASTSVKAEPATVSEDNNPNLQEKFSEQDLHHIWPKFISRYSTQGHLYNTLENKPALEEDNIVVISVENSVQQEKIRLLKPEIIGYLRRELKNDLIDVRVDLIEREESEVKIITDEQKLKVMMQKNPAIMLFKNKFNLDFSG